MRDLGSFDWYCILRPRSFRNTSVLGPKAPSVSIAIGMKECPRLRLAYFASFLSSAAAATAPVLLVANPRYDGANVSGQVASQTRGFPNFHGTMVTPSGRFPSDRSSPDGSSRDGILAEEKAREMTSFTAECRKCRPSLLLHLRPWVARWSTSAPQCRQEWGWHRVEPRRRPTAHLMVLSSILRPNDDTGRAWSHAPDSGAETARRRARDTSSGACSNKSSAILVTLGLSQAF